MMSNFLCWMGFHSLKIRSIWHPSFTAPVVTALEIVVTCKVCNKTIAHDRMRIPE